MRLSCPDFFFQGLTLTTWKQAFGPCLTAAVLFLVATIFWFHYHQQQQQQQKKDVPLDSREPPLLRPTVPILGHVLRMWRDGGGYYLDMHRRLGSQAHAVTLNILGQKFYVLLSPSLVQAAFRNRHLTSERFNIQSATGVVGLSAEAKHVLEHGSLLQDFYRNMPLAMAPEPLRRMTSTALSTLSADLNGLAAAAAVGGGGSGHDVAGGQELPDLYRFLRDRIVLATTDGLYGAKTNPIRSRPGLVEDVWTFDEAMFTLFWNVAPKITAPAGHRARSRLQQVLISYFQKYPDDNAFPDDAAELTRMRSRILRAAGVSDADVGNMEVGMIHAAVANTAPILFWMVANVFSRPPVLAKLRAEVEKLVQVDENTHDTATAAATATCTLRAAQLTDPSLCPYVAAVNREVLRLCDSVTATRFVDEDVMLPDGTLLKDGAMVHMPSAVAHRMSEAWGPHDADDFEPERWIGSLGGADPGIPEEDAAATTTTMTTAKNAALQTLQRKAFWPFGGGKHLCPGRKFAFAETMTFVAALAVGFDISEGLGVDAVPQCGCANLTGQSVPKPNRRVKVQMRRRKGWEGVRWLLLA